MPDYLWFLAGILSFLYALGCFCAWGIITQVEPPLSRLEVFLYTLGSWGSIVCIVVEGL